MCMPTFVGVVIGMNSLDIPKIKNDFVNGMYTYPYTSYANLKNIFLK